MYYLSDNLAAEILHLKARIADESLRLKHMREAPAHTYPWIEIRKTELGLDSYRSRLRMMEHAATKFDPDQPRVPAGNGDRSGEWTDTGGRSYGSSSGAKPNQRLLPSTIRPSGSFSAPAKPINPEPRVGRGQLGAVGAAQTLRQLLQDADPESFSFSGPLDESIDRYNWLLEKPDLKVVPAIHFTPREYRESPENLAKTKAVVVPLLREQVEEACPRYWTVQSLTNLAAEDAGKKSDYPSPADYGTAVHKRLKERIVKLGDESLIPERSYLKYREETSDHYGRRGVHYGYPDSVRLDVLERVENGVICVYDVKTGRYGLSTRRVIEIGASVRKNFGSVNRILIIPLKPETMK